jgi:aconitate hydratase
MSQDSFGSRGRLEAGGRTYDYYRLEALEDRFDIGRLPFSLKVLLENLLRHEDGVSVRKEDIEALAGWDPAAKPDTEIAFAPARILLQDFTGVPAVVDLAAMRDAMAKLGGDPAKVNPKIPAELVIDHSIVADVAGIPGAYETNARLEFDRNRQRYAFLRWGQGAFDGLEVVPPNTGICHQVNLEYLARVVFDDGGLAYPDTLVGTDSHTPMINGLGVLGWGVGGIEAEAAMLGQPISMLIPKVVGFKLSGSLPPGTTATDLVLTITQMLRRHGVVGKFVEFYGPGVSALPLENRATIGNMSPEYGSTATMFPIDEETLRYLAFTGRPEARIELVRAYAEAQGMWHDPDAEPRFSETLALDLSTVVPSLAGPTRPQDRVPLDAAKPMFEAALEAMLPEAAATRKRQPDGRMPLNVLEGSPEDASADSFPASDPPAIGNHPDGAPDPNPEPYGSDHAGAPAHHTAVPVKLADGRRFDLDHGHVVIAAITSCTNTSNPSVMLAAGLLAKKAVEKGLSSKPWVKTSLAPGSKVVMDYYARAGLLPDLEKLGFHLVGYGCTTCIGNSGPLLPEISRAVDEGGLAVCSVLSGNRNFEGRINPDCRMNYLASPPLVVAYALAGSMDLDLMNTPLGEGTDGKPVYLKDVWPTPQEIDRAIADSVRKEMFEASYADVYAGDENWRGLEVAAGSRYAWDAESTYVREPTFFSGLSAEPPALKDVKGARVLALLGDSVTTDHISPAGVIKPSSPAGQWLVEQGVAPADFNSYGARRGNHEVMIRGTFANIRLRNRLAPGTEGGFTRHLPGGEVTTIYEAAMRYAEEGVPLVVLAGKEYGSGSSRDWAAKGTALLGVRAVIAESYERIHRSNLIGMGVLPLQLVDGATVSSLGLTGEEVFAITGLEAAGDEGPLPERLTVEADDKRFEVAVRIDTPKEAAYYRNGGILHYVLRQLAAA